MNTVERPMRDRILQVALELFTERGYDGTSLREIAEKLDVTKAALYYHFKSKEALLIALVIDWRGQVTELVRWGHEQPFSTELQRVMLERLAAMLNSNPKVMRLLFENQPVIRALIATDDAQNQRNARSWIFDFIAAITPPEADAVTRARIRAAAFAIVSGPMQPNTATADLDASLTVALDLVGQHE